MKRSLLPSVPLLLALVGGIAIAVVDRGASDVQGPLLLLMLVAFVASALSVETAARGAVTVAVACAFGFTVSHAGAGFGGGVGGLLLMMAVSTLACLIAALCGMVGRLLVTRAARSLPRTERSAVGGASPAGPWYATESGSRSLLAAAFAVAAGMLAVLAASSIAAVGQRTPVWLALIWSMVSVACWLVVAPAWISTRIRLGTAGDIVRLVGLFLVMVIVHASLLVTVTIMLFVHPDSPGALWRVAATTVLPIDALVAVLVQQIAFASDADRLREHARAANDAATLAALRAQLQPHFFLNALNSAATLARRGDVRGVLDVIEQLGELLRAFVGDGREMIPLGEELSFVDRYLSVERIRFPDRLTYTVTADDASRSVRVPAMILQPLAENAVVHGIAPVLAAGAVTINASVSDGDMRIIVHDTGPGPNQTTMRLGTGLDNVKRRLRAVYGDRASLSVSGSPAGGTDATITIASA